MKSPKDGDLSARKEVIITFRVLGTRGKFVVRIQKSRGEMRSSGLALYGMGIAWLELVSLEGHEKSDI